MLLRDDTRISVRKLGFAEFEDYRDHLLRLDKAARTARFGAPIDDKAVLTHCLTLVLGPTLVVAALNRGQVRGACEIQIDAETGAAQVALSLESAWQGRGHGRKLMQESLITCFGTGVDIAGMNVQTGNGRMLKLAKRFGFEARDTAHPGVFTTHLDSLAPIMTAA